MLWLLRACSVTVRSVHSPSGPYQSRSCPRKNAIEAALPSSAYRAEARQRARLRAAKGWESLRNDHGHELTLTQLYRLLRDRRGAMAGALKKKLGLEVTSEMVEDRGRVYKLPALLHKSDEGIHLVNPV